MKTGRFVSTLVAVLLVVTAAAPASAARKKPASPETVPVAFTITSSQCSSVPAGADVYAEGFQTNVSRVHATGGVLREIVTSHASGSATDLLGNTYVWSYSYQQHATSSDGQRWVGSAMDHFSLTGSGPVHIVAGFAGGVAYDANTLKYTPRIVIGDPIDFDDNSPHCDPL